MFSTLNISAALPAHLFYLIFLTFTTSIFSRSQSTKCIFLSNDRTPLQLLEKPEEAKLIAFISIHFGINWGDSHAGIPGWRIRGSKYLKFEVAVDEVTEQKLQK